MANRILLRYVEGPLICNGLPSKYTVLSFFLSPNSFSTSSNDAKSLDEAQNSSKCSRWPMPWRNFILFLEMSMTLRRVLDARPLSSTRALSAMCNSSRLSREVRPDILVRRFDWTERSLRLESEPRFCSNWVKNSYAMHALTQYLQLSDLVLSEPQLLQSWQRLEVFYFLHWVSGTVRRRIFITNSNSVGSKLKVSDLGQTL